MVDGHDSRMDNGSGTYAYNGGNLENVWNTFSSTIKRDFITRTLKRIQSKIIEVGVVPLTSDENEVMRGRTTPRSPETGSVKI